MAKEREAEKPTTPPTQIDIFVSTGERSGDLLAAQLLKSLLSEYRIGGVVGPELRSLGVTELFAMESFQIMGFSAILSHLPQLISLGLRIRDTILAKNPKVVVCVDNSDFHLLLARFLRKKGYRGKIVQVVCPSIWAWRKKRKKTLESYFDLLCTLFPFEKDLFHHSPLETLYLGHPLVEKIKEQHRNFQKEKVIALFPGSRKAEIKRHLPLQLDIVRPFTGDYTIAIGVSHEHLLPLIREIIEKESSPPTLVASALRYELMQKATLALAKFGTITLELSLLQVPTVAHYSVPPLEKFLLRHFFRVSLPFYSLPNILCKEEIFKEFLFPLSSFHELQTHTRDLLHNPEAQKTCIEGCKKVHQILSSTSPSEVFSTRIRAMLPPNKYLY